MMATAKPEEGKYSTLDLKGPSYSTYIAFNMDDFEMFYNRYDQKGPPFVLTLPPGMSLEVHDCSSSA
jgi:hypothetical protein